MFYLVSNLVGANRKKEQEILRLFYFYNNINCAFYYEHFHIIIESV